MTLTQRGSSLYEAKLARPTEELRQNGVTIQIILDADYLLVERNWYGFASFWSENGYRLCPFWSGIGYSFRGSYGGI